MSKTQAAADQRLDLIEAITAEVQGLNPVRLQNVLRYVRKQYVKQVEYHREFIDGPTPATKPKPKREVKNGWYTEIRTIRNRASGKGKTYQWKYSQLYIDGKRAKGEGTCKSLGRVK